MTKTYYQILDVALSLETDSAEFLELFDRDFCWFRKHALDAGASLDVSVRLDGAGGEGAYARINEEPIGIEGHPNPKLFAYQAVLKAFHQATREFVLLHAGVVVADGMAAIITGPACSGKTTLTLELLDRGCTFFSDEFCPIHRQTRLVHPFPRSLWVSRESSFAVRNALSAPSDGIRGGKVPLKMKPGELGFAVAEKACRAGCLIYLQAADDADPTGTINIGFREKHGRVLLDELALLEGVKAERAHPDSSEWYVRYVKSPENTRKIRELLKVHESQIWHAHRISVAHPDFSREPELAPIPVHKAAFHLLADLKREPTFDPDDTDWSTGPGGAFLELIDLLKGVPCYSLTVGKLDAMKALALQAVNARR